MNTNIEFTTCHTLYLAGVITHTQMTDAIALFRRKRNAQVTVGVTQVPPAVDEPTVTVTRRRFSDEDTETLKRLYAKGWTTLAISKELGRTHATIIQKVKRYQQAGVLPRRYRPRVGK